MTDRPDLTPPSGCASLATCAFPILRVLPCGTKLAWVSSVARSLITNPPSFPSGRDVGSHTALRNERSYHFVLLVITIDEFLAVSNHCPFLYSTRAKVTSRYTVKTLGLGKHLLRWKVDCTPTSISISQPAFFADIFKRLRMETCNLSPIPYETTVISARKTDEAKLRSTTPYSAAVGCIRYLADSTRPDLAFFMVLLGPVLTRPLPTTLARSTSSPTLTSAHTPTHGITYTNTTSPRPLDAYSDSDIASCLYTLRSTSGFFALWRQGPIAWQSKRQKFVASSTWEAEYISAFHASQHTSCLHNLLRAFRALDPSIPTLLHIDNAGTITTAKSPHPTPKSKHIDVKCHYVNEQVLRRRITPAKIPSRDNPADCLTKRLKPTIF